MLSIIYLKLNEMASYFVLIVCTFQIQGKIINEICIYDMYLAVVFNRVLIFPVIISTWQVVLT